VVLHLEVGLHGAQRLMRPLLERMLGRNLAGDAERLRDLVRAERRSTPAWISSAQQVVTKSQRAT
jgi:hypothetical protein